MHGTSERVGLTDLVAQVRTFTGLTGKAAIALVSDVLGPSDWVSGPGDDGAVTVIDVFDDSRDVNIVSCGEAIHPQFVRQDPYGAGIAAVLANVNDLAAMGARPLCIVDTVIATADVARRSSRASAMPVACTTCRSSAATSPTTSGNRPCRPSPWDRPPVRSR